MSASAAPLGFWALMRAWWALVYQAVTVSMKFMSFANVNAAILQGDNVTLAAQVAAVLMVVLPAFLSIWLFSRIALAARRLPAVTERLHPPEPPLVFGDLVGDAYAIPDGHGVENVDSRHHRFRNEARKALESTFVPAEPPVSLMLLHGRPECRGKGGALSIVECEFSVFKPSSRKHTKSRIRPWHCCGCNEEFFEAAVQEKYNHLCRHCGEVLLFELRTGHKIMGAEKKRATGNSKFWAMDFNHAMCMAPPCVTRPSSLDGESRQLDPTPDSGRTTLSVRDSD